MQRVTVEGMDVNKGLHLVSAAHCNRMRHQLWVWGSHKMTNKNLVSSIQYVKKNHAPFNTFL